MATLYPVTDAKKLKVLDAMEKRIMCKRYKNEWMSE